MLSLARPDSYYQVCIYGTQTLIMRGFTSVNGQGLPCSRDRVGMCRRVVVRPIYGARVPVLRPAP